MKRLLGWPAALALAALVFTADLRTGSELSVSFFYLIPVALATWGAGAVAGLALALACSGGWLAAVLLDRPIAWQGSLVWWNAAIEALIFTSAALALSRIRSGLAHERALRFRLAEAHRRLDLEAEKVGRLQREMLPAALPEVSGVRSAVRYETSTRAGGDYYDAWRVDGDRIGLLIADASGHGTPAAVVMAVTRAVLRTSAGPFDAPEAVLARLDEGLRRAAPDGQFVTAACVVFDAATRALEFAIAGHDPPVVARRGRVEWLAEPSGVPLAVNGGGGYARGRATLEPGDALLLYTDGIPETRGADGQFYGRDRLAELLARVRAHPVERALDAIVSDVVAFAGGAPPEDDRTLLLVRVEG